MSCWLIASCLAGVCRGRTCSRRSRLSVDATEAPRKIFHARMTIPAKPGTLTLYYPKWIPGEHGPTGPIQDLAGLKFTANGKALAWRRDLLDGWTFHVEVPAGVIQRRSLAGFHLARRVEKASTPAAPRPPTRWQSSTGTPCCCIPQGWTSDELTYTASLRLPAGWKFGTSLAVASQSGGRDQVRSGFADHAGRWPRDHRTNI